MPLEIISLVSEAAVAFEGGEQLAADLASYPFGADLLKEKYGMEVVGLQLQQADQAVFWLGRKGGMKLGERRIAIDTARGNPRMLAASVQGTTETALDALQELWTTLSAAAAEVFAIPGATDFGRVQSLGKTFPNTVAIVRMPCEARDLFPQMRFLQRKMGEGAHGNQMRVSPEARMRFTCEFKFEWGAQSIVTPLTIEPRANEPLSSRIFFTRSPLPNDAHLKLIEEFAAECGRR